MYNKILWGASAKSLELRSPKVDFIVDDKWNTYPLKYRIFLEIHWRLMLRKPFKKVCYTPDILLKLNHAEYDVILGDIYRREEILNKAKKYGYISEINFFEAFSLSSEYCKKNRGMVSKDDIEKKDFEEDNLKLSIMAQLIDDEIKSICDLGCGEQLLKDLLPKSVKYYGVDYINKGQELCCDFNKGEFPDINVDCYFGCGILEFIIDYKSFLSKIAESGSKYIILSYSVREFSSFTTFRSPVYNNCIYSNEIASIICSRGFELTDFIRYENRQALFKFKRLQDS